MRVHLDNAGVFNIIADSSTEVFAIKHLQRVAKDSGNDQPHVVWDLSIEHEENQIQLGRAVGQVGALRGPGEA